MQDSEPQSPKPTLDRNQKLAIFVLAVFGFFIIILWLVQFNKSLTDPFQYKGSATSTDQSDLTASSTSDVALKNKDTDGDGLSDWDELNIYHTSPYLADSDSDGIPDGTEVKNGTDPNCVEGKICAASTDLVATSTDNSQLSASSTSSYQPNLNISSSTDQAGLQTMLNGQMDAATLRKTLLDSGMDPKMLSALSDQELLSNYQQVLNNNKTN